MKFSAVIPVYNGAKYIKSLASDLQAQTYKNFETIFINDGSTDDTLHVLEDVRQNAEFEIKIINQENKGVSAARNAGIFSAKGTWITFIDVDDGIPPDLFETLEKITLNTKCDFYIFKFAHCRQKLDTTIKGIRQLDRNTALYEFLYGQIKAGIWGTAVKKSLLVQNHLSFAENCRYGEDQHMLWQLIATSQNVALVDSTIYLYNINMNSAMRYFPPSRFQALDAVHSLEPFMLQYAPDFYPSFKKYAPARICWSLLWQAAAFLSAKEFLKLYRQKNLHPYIKELTSFPELKVKISSEILLCQPLLFYSLAHLYAPKILFNYSC